MDGNPREDSQVLTKFNPASSTQPPQFSHGVEATAFQKILFVSGQVGARSDGTIVDGIEAQARQAYNNIVAVLIGSGMTLDDVAKFTVYLTDEQYAPAFRKVRAEFLPSPPPASTLVIVKALGTPAIFVEIEAIAIK